MVISPSIKIQHTQFGHGLLFFQRNSNNQCFSPLYLILPSWFFDSYFSLFFRRKSKQLVFLTTLFLFYPSWVVRLGRAYPARQADETVQDAITCSVMLKDSSIPIAGNLYLTGRGVYFYSNLFRHGRWSVGGQLVMDCTRVSYPPTNSEYIASYRAQ
jgi:hypothetical protein